MSRLSYQSCLLSLGLVGLACGDDGGAPTSASGITSVTGSTSSGTGTDGTTTGDPTTGDPTTTTTTTTGTTTTTTGTATTGTTDDPTGTTGPICDPGGVNCVCDEGACDDGLTCIGDVCVLDGVCDDDAGEPDDDEASAHDLGEIDDDDDNTVMAAGVLSGVTDVDWYTYHALDIFGHTAEPTIKVMSSAAVRVCQFIECDNGGAVMTELSCPVGTQSALSGALRPGCCGGATFAMPDFNCPGSSDDLQVYVRIDMASQDECVEYSLIGHN